MSAPDVFNYGGTEVRTIVIDGDPWFVASDVATVLGYSATAAMTRSLDADEKGVQILHTLGGEQQFTVISESGLYDAILRSRVAEAQGFKRWLKRDVLPTIRRTGSYSTTPELSPDELIHRALTVATERIAAAEAKVKELEPAAQAWQDIASGEGSWAAREAAQMLCNAGVMIGQNRLLAKLDELGWTFHQGGQRHIKQTAREAGLLEPRIYPPRYKPSGERLQVAPQVRITGKGLNRLLDEMRVAS